MNVVRFLDDPELKHLTQRFKDGDPIFRQGEKGDAMFIVIDGNVRMVLDRDGEEHIAEILERGQFFGERAIFSKEPVTRFMSAVARGHVILLRLTSGNFTELETKHPKLAIELLKEVFLEAASRLGRSNDLVRLLRPSDNYERVVQLTAHFGKFNGNKVVEGTEVILNNALYANYIDLDETELEACINTLLALKVIHRKVGNYYIIPNEAKLLAAGPELRKKLPDIIKNPPGHGKVVPFPSKNEDGGSGLFKFLKKK